MNRWFVPQTLLALVLVGSVSGQDFRLTFADVGVKVREPQGWVEMSVGEVVPSSGVVVLDQDGGAEFSDGKDRLILRRRGLYDLNAVWKHRRIVQDSSVFRVLSSLLGTRSTTPTTNMGVRGQQEGDLPQEDFSRQALVLTKVQDLVNEGRPREALAYVMAEEPDPYLPHFAELAEMALELLSRYGDPGEFSICLERWGPFLPGLPTSPSP